jgi:Rrf2 family protein
MIRLSKQADYGFLAMRHLCLSPEGQFWSAREIADRFGIPPALMAKLLQRLARKGLLFSHHGKRGGYQIARPASKITLWEVIEAIEGPPRLEGCVHTSGDGCPRPDACSGQRPLAAMHRKITEWLGSTTLSDLTDTGGGRYGR